MFKFKVAVALEFILLLLVNVLVQWTSIGIGGAKNLVNY